MQSSEEETNVHFSKLGNRNIQEWKKMILKIWEILKVVQEILL